MAAMLLKNMKKAAAGSPGTIATPLAYDCSERETEGKLLRLLPSLPSGMDLRYSVSPRWAIPTPVIPPCLAN